MTALVASQEETRTFRNRRLWEEEARTIRTSAQSLPPVARHRVRAVLEAIVYETEDGDIAASAGSLLTVLEELERELGEKDRVVQRAF
jgi:hypothetical protein